MLTGGRSRLNKIVTLVFADDDRGPRLAVKRARVPEAEAALQREVSALRRVAGTRMAQLADVPEIVFAEPVGDALAVGETVVDGQPLTATLTAPRHAQLARQVTDTLAALALGVPFVPTTQYWSRLVDPVFADFQARFESVVDTHELQLVEQAMAALPPLPMVPEHRDCSPWNLLCTDSGRLALLDWESAEPEGLPFLDLVYYLTNATFLIDGSLDSGRERASYTSMLDPTSPTGRVFADAAEHYGTTIGISDSALTTLRAFTWMVHAPGEHQRIQSLHPDLAEDEAARRSVFLELWREDVRRLPR
jgi:hypothetical protein